MHVKYVPEEEVRQSASCSTRDISPNAGDWRQAFKKNSISSLDLKSAVWVADLNLPAGKNLPGKDIMVQIPSGDATHLKKR